MAIAISLTLASTMFLSVLLAYRIYHYNKGNLHFQLVFVAALFVTAISFLEYEISRQTFLDTVTFLGDVHIILCSFTVFVCIVSLWVIAPPLPKNKYPWLNKVLLLSNSLLMVSFWIPVFQGEHFASEISYTGHIWQYQIDIDSAYKVAFVLWCAIQALCPIFVLFHLYKRTKKGKAKNWILLTLITSAIVFPVIFFVFSYAGQSSTTGFYFVSPCLLISGTALCIIFKRFSLFKVSPVHAFDNILELMYNLMAIADTDFNITYFNRATLTELKIEEGELPAISFNNIAQRYAAKDWDEHAVAIKALPKGKNYSKEFELTDNGGALFYRITFSPIFNERNTKTGYLAIATNITQTKKSEKQLQRYNYELERSNTELERFVYIASHDLKTPLRSVSSFLSLIQRHVGKNYDDPRLQELLDFANNGARQMAHLIQDVLEYSKVADGVKNIDEAVDLNDTIETVCQTLKSVIEEKNAIIFAEALPVIQADQSRMLQLFQNMIENGIKYNESDQPNIYISYFETENDHQISVRDNGIGIEEDYNEHIFEMFKRLHNSTEYEGTGIGLAICKKIVMQCGGDISLQSKLGKGSQFVITLPKVRKRIEIFENEKSQVISVQQAILQAATNPVAPPAKID